MLVVEYFTIWLALCAYLKAREKTVHFTLYFTFREADFKVHFFIVQVSCTQSDLGSYNWKFESNIVAFQIFFDVLFESHLTPGRNIIGTVGIAVDFNIITQLEQKKTQSFDALNKFKTAYLVCILLED